MKKRFRLLLALLLALLLIAACLTAVESRAEGASIANYWDALWYCLVTLTTVGYGDLYPVTAVGRVLGAVIVLCSLGFLTVLISTAVSLVQGRLLPALSLWQHRKCKWYVFDGDSPELRSFADRLAAEEPGCVCLFCREDAQSHERLKTEHGTAFLWGGSVEDAVRSHKNGETALLFLQEEDSENYTKAVSAQKSGCPVFCRTQLIPEETLGGLTLFSDSRCLGRSYWQKYPVKKNEETFVLIGNGYAPLLEYGLQTNVLPRGRTLSYHVIAEDRSFAELHPQIGDFSDKVCFHAESWTACRELIAQADRVILCMDTDGGNLSALSTIRSCIPVRGQLYVHLCRSVPVRETVIFGTAEELLTPENVLMEQQYALARKMHEIYRSGADYPVPAWEELSEFLRQSNLAAADHLTMKLRLLLDTDEPVEPTPELCAAAYKKYLAALNAQGGSTYWELEHRRWVRFHALHGWQYAPVRNNALRQHPSMVPFDRLSREEQEKDDYAWSLLGKLAGPERKEEKRPGNV